MIFSLDARFLFLHCSLMSASLKGGNKTVINMGKYHDRNVNAIAVLHRECGSFGKTNRLMCAWCDGFNMFALLSPQHIICVRASRAVLLPSLIFGCSGLFNVCIIRICLDKLNCNIAFVSPRP